MFHDRAKLTVIAGRGGDGAIHFRREKYVPKGGPDGGDGGDGGDVVLVADSRRRDLSGFRPNQKVRAGRGGRGGGRLSHGARGEDAVLRVPVGTQVRDASEGL
ncbi:MAG TPA: GTPase CgtA, partial [Gaiellaceae bacterium]|nr:GTPase CgtA [Gaiellaceae bacterium]